MSDNRVVYVSVSGSFNRFLPQVQESVREFTDHDAIVLSPQDPRPVETFDTFLFVASDVRRTIKGTQNRHLAAIRSSDFLWLVCPGGYVGSSASMEIGFAVAHGVPIYATERPKDITLRQYVSIAKQPTEVVAKHMEGEPSPTDYDNLLLYPSHALSLILKDLERIESATKSSQEIHEEPIERKAARIKALLSPLGKQSP